MHVVGVLQHCDDVDGQAVPKSGRGETDGGEMKIVSIGVMSVPVIEQRRVGVAPDQSIVTPASSVSAEPYRPYSLLDLTGRKLAHGKFWRLGSRSSRKRRDPGYDDQQP